MSHEVDEVYRVYRESVRRARKEHRCSACDEAIAPGYLYMHVAAISDGVDVYRRCARCQEIHMHLRGLGDGDMWPDERLNCGEEYRAHWGIGPPAEVAELAFMSSEEAQRLLSKEGKP